MDKKIVSEVLSELFSGMDTLIDTKTVVGEPKIFGETVIVPLIEVSFAMGAGSFDASIRKKNNERGGLGAKIKPSAVIVIKNGSTRLINVGKSSSLEKVIDLAPDLIDKLSNGEKRTKLEDDAIIKKAFGSDVKI